MAQQTENALTIIGTPNANTATNRPLPMDEPAMDASFEPVTIDLAAIEARIEPPNSETIEQDQTAPNDGGARRHKFSALAASITLAALFGALGGTAATAIVLRHVPAEANATAALPDETHALQEQVGKLSAELAVLKSGLDAAHRTSANQLSKIGERLDRAEKAQTEPATKLAKIAESLDRLERRVASAAAPDVTNSVTSVEKQQAKLPTVEGWKLLDYYAGRAVLESRRGTLFEVGPGSNLPGVGKVETIKRVDGKIVVTTPKGIITSSLESPRRTPYYRPRGY
jgi:hypothetical protein